MRVLATAASLFIVAVSAAPTELEKRDTVLADGFSVQNGALPDWGFQYHASGYLAKGGCPAGSKISTCYTYSLDAKPSLNSETDAYGTRIQSVMQTSASHPADGQVRQYTFRMQLDPSLTSTSLDSCPLVGITTPGEDGSPVSPVYLDVRNNLAGIYAFTDTATPSVSMSLAEFVGKSTYQTWTVKSGPGGWADVKVVGEGTGATLLKYNATGQNSWGTYSMSVGTARGSVAGMKPMKVYWGDWAGKYV